MLLWIVSAIILGTTCSNVVSKIRARQIVVEVVMILWDTSTAFTNKEFSLVACY